LLNDPIVITEYRGPKGDIDNTVNVYGNFFLPNSNTPIVVGVVMRMDRSGQNVITNVRTVHARSDFAKHITDDTVLYLNEDKKKTRKWFQVCGNLNVPLEGTKYGPIRSIAFTQKKSNTNLMKPSIRQPNTTADAHPVEEEAIRQKVQAQIESLKEQYRKAVEEEELERAFLRGFNAEE